MRMAFLGCLVLSCSLVWPSLALSRDLSIVEILQKADESRGNLEGVIWDVRLESHEEDDHDSMSFRVKARGFDSVSENTAPPKDKGKTILMVNRNMWFHKPDLSKPVPIPRRQKLLGNAAYGDIASTDYAHEYNATIMGEEEIDGEACYVFDLVSKDKKTTYDRIKYWVSKERLVGIKAEYFTVSGKLFKSARMDYANTIKIGADTRPFISQIIFYDELLGTNITYLIFKNPTFRNIPDYVFNLNLLGR